MGTLCQYPLSSIELVVDPLLGIDHLDLAQSINGSKPTRFVLRQVIAKAAEITQQPSMLIDQAVITLFKVRQENVADTQSVATGLVHVGRTDAAQRRSDLVLALFLLVGRIKQPMGGQNQVRFA